MDYLIKTLVQGFLFFTHFLQTGSGSLLPQLRPYITTVQEDETFTLKCSYNISEFNPGFCRWIWEVNTTYSSVVGSMVNGVISIPNTYKHLRLNFSHVVDKSLFTLEKHLVNRSDHNTTWYCQLLGHNTWIKSNPATLYVNGRVTLQNAVTLQISKPAILEHSNVTLTCTYTGLGNVQASKWEMADLTSYVGLDGSKCHGFNPLNNKTLYILSCVPANSFSVTILNVTRQIHNDVWKCTTVDDRQTSISITLNVTVPVKEVTLVGMHQLLENSTALFACSTSLSTPQPNIVWFKQNNVTTTEIRNGSFAAITRRENVKDGNLVQVTEQLLYTVNRFINGWNIYCSASNWMNSQVTSNNITLNVTYPPDGPPVIQDFTNGSTYTVAETKLASLSCSVEGGNPLGKPKFVCKDAINNITKEDVYLSKVTTSLSWTATRNQGKTCICRTDHALSKEFVSININVLYKASVKKFKVHGHENENPVVANESTTILFTCEIDSNPISTVTINSPSGKVLGSSNKSIIGYNHTLLSCLDSGIYSCSGSNVYNYGQQASADISLLVNCKPMASSGIQEDKRSEPNVPVTLTFTAIAYPEPEYTWEILTGSSWKQITEQSKFSISSSGMQSNMTVNNFTSSETTITHFRIIVTNFIGTFILDYTLRSFGRPNQPTELNHIPDLLTSASVTLIWKPGFNGGTAQHFSLKYKGENEQEWDTVVLQDTGGVLMYFTIRGLSSSTKYEFQIVAENIIASSASSILRIQTKASEPTTEKFDNLVGFVAGSITGVIIIVVGVVFGIYLYRKRYQRGNDRGNERRRSVKSYDEVSEMTTITDGHAQYTKETAYEDIRSVGDRESVERLEKSYDQLKPDKDDIGSINPVYTNLTL